MKKTQVLIVRVTPEQNQILIAKTRSAGFLKKADYVRSILFMSLSTEEKINKIFDKVCENG